MTAPDGMKWYIQRRTSRALGPFSSKEIVEGIASGEIPRDSVVCGVGDKIWVPIQSVEAFRSVARASTKPIGSPVSPMSAMPMATSARGAAHVGASPNGPNAPAAPGMISAGAPRTTALATAPTGAFKTAPGSATPVARPLPPSTARLSSPSRDPLDTRTVGAAREGPPPWDTAPAVTAVTTASTSAVVKNPTSTGTTAATPTGSDAVPASALPLPRASTTVPAPVSSGLGRSGFASPRVCRRCGKPVANESTLCAEHALEEAVDAVAVRPLGRSLERRFAAVALGGLVGVVGLSWTLLQLADMARGMPKQAELFDALRPLRADAVLRPAFALVGYVALLVGAVLTWLRRPSGRPLVRGTAIFMLGATVTLSTITLAGSMTSPRWASVESALRGDIVRSLVVGVLGALVCWGLHLYFFRDTLEDMERRDLRPRGRRAGWGWATSMWVWFSVVAFAAFPAAVGVRGFAARNDLLYVAVATGVPVVGFTDREALTLFLEGVNEGSAGTEKIDRSFARGVVVPPNTRARFVDEFRLSTTYGGDVGREVALLDGEHAGRRVFVSRRTARPRPGP